MDNFQTTVLEQFGKIGKQFEAIDKRFGVMDKKFEASDARFDELMEFFGTNMVTKLDLKETIDDLEGRMNVRFLGIEKQLSALEGRVTALEIRMSSMEAHMGSIEYELGEIKNEISKLEKRARQDADVVAHEVVVLKKRVTKIELDVQRGAKA